MAEGTTMVRESVIKVLQREVMRREREITILKLRLERLRELLLFLSSIEDQMPKGAEEALWSMVTLLRDGSE